MIIFESISYKNFLSTGNVPVEIQLNSTPVTGIVGKNGTGKSTIIDATYFALYGKAFRKIKKEQIVNSINKKNLLTTLKFSVDGKSYKIIRGIKPNIFEVYVDGKLKEQDASIKDYQTWLESSILKINETTMKQIVFLGSTSFVPFMKLPISARRKVVEEILDIQIFSVMNKILKERVTVSGNQYRDILSELTLLGNSIELKERHLEELSLHRKSLITDKENIRMRKENNKSEIEEQISADGKLVDMLMYKIEDAANNNKNKIELDDIIRGMKRNITRADKDVSFYENNDNCPTCKQDMDKESAAIGAVVRKLKNKSDSISSALTEATRKLHDFEKRASEIYEIEHEIQTTQLGISNHQTSVTSLNNDIKRLVSEIEELQATPTDNLVNLREEIAIHETESSKLRDSRAELSDESQYYGVISGLLKDDAIKSKIIDAYIPTINSLIRANLEKLDFSCEFTFDSEFKETMKSRGRDNFSYANFSEGQMLRIDLSIMFAFRELARLRNSTAVSLLVLDEVGSSAMDADGKEAFLTLIGDLGKETNAFIITHDQSTLDGDSFGNTLEFDIVNNFTVLKK
ncbi:MAG: AAA family ATPase [Ghiorsea sp.]